MVEESLGKSHPHIERIREPYCGSFKLLYAKMWSFAFLPEERSRICVFFIDLFRRSEEGVLE